MLIRTLDVDTVLLNGTRGAKDSPDATYVDWNDIDARLDADADNDAIAAAYDAGR